MYQNTTPLLPFRVPIIAVAGLSWNLRCMFSPIANAYFRKLGETHLHNRTFGCKGLVPHLKCP